MTGPPASAWVVEDEWLWNSIQIDNRVGEKCFFPRRLLAKRNDNSEITESNSRKRGPDTLVTSKSSNSNISLQSESKFIRILFVNKWVFRQNYCVD